MSLPRVVLATLFVSALSACGPGEATVDGTVTEPALETSEDALALDCTGKLLVGESLISYSSGGREYRVYTPPGYSPYRFTPVVLSLHGASGNMDENAEGTQLRAAAASNSTGRKFIIVEANGTPVTPRSDRRTWNGGNSTGPGSDLNAAKNGIAPVDDVGFLTRAVAEVKSRYCVDARRVYSVGLSNGGEMSHRLACQAGHVFAAIAAVGGGRGDLNLDVSPARVLYTCPQDPARKAAVLDIHGDADKCWPYDGGASPLDFVAPLYPSVELTMGQGGWMTRHRCSPSLTTVFDFSDGKTRTTCQQYDGCATPGAVMRCKVSGGGHVWPGGSGPYSTQSICGGQKPQTFNNDLLLGWLLQHPMP